MYTINLNILCVLVVYMTLLQKGHCTAKHAKVAKKKTKSQIFFQDNLRESLTFLKRL